MVKFNISGIPLKLAANLVWKQNCEIKVFALKCLNCSIVQPNRKRSALVQSEDKRMVF